MYIFDIDGTLSIMYPKRARLLLQNTVNWSEFFNLAAYDEPNQPVIDLCKRLIRSDGAKVVYMTGRPERIRGLTTGWLAIHGIYFKHGHLYMRADDDFRPDHIIKEEMAKPFMSEINMVFEDRTTVVNMWRRNGVPCCQVNDFVELRREK